MDEERLGVAARPTWRIRSPRTASIIEAARRSAARMLLRRRRTPMATGAEVVAEAGARRGWEQLLSLPSVWSPPPEARLPRRSAQVRGRGPSGTPAGQAARDGLEGVRVRASCSPPRACSFPVAAMSCWMSQKGRARFVEPRTRRAPVPPGLQLEVSAAVQYDPQEARCDRGRALLLRSGDWGRQGATTSSGSAPTSWTIPLP